MSLALINVQINHFPADGSHICTPDTPDSVYELPSAQKHHRCFSSAFDFGGIKRRGLSVCERVGGCWFVGRCPIGTRLGKFPESVARSSLDTRSERPLSRIPPSLFPLHPATSTTPLLSPLPLHHVKCSTGNKVGKVGIKVGLLPRHLLNYSSNRLRRCLFANANHAEVDSLGYCIGICE